MSSIPRNRILIFVREDGAASYQGRLTVDLHCILILLWRLGKVL